MENKKQIKEMKQTIEDNEEEIREAYLEAVLNQYRVPRNQGRIIKLYLNLETAEVYTHVYASSNSYTRFEDDAIIQIATIKGWNVFNRWSKENPEGETKEGYLYNPHYDFNDGWEAENRVVDTVIEEEAGKHFDDFLMLAIRDEIERVAQDRQLRLERTRKQVIQ